ncbi:unnamed protein product [Microthlaspi erraticum]|uniref:Uncharacterized protein n=1 Tax=Microthlaspi erraticum TaxID=1685480 RepID=A0A6D2HSA9_9BRAS|nr:unnamed protein product [Microthlaspi erraticum]
MVVFRESVTVKESLLVPEVKDIWNTTWYPKASDHVNTDKPCLGELYSVTCKYTKALSIPLRHNSRLICLSGTRDYSCKNRETPWNTSTKLQCSPYGQRVFVVSSSQNQRKLCRFLYPLLAFVNSMM